MSRSLSWAPRLRSPAAGMSSPIEYRYPSAEVVLVDTDGPDVTERIERLRDDPIAQSSPLNVTLRACADAAGWLEYHTSKKEEKKRRKTFRLLGESAQFAGTDGAILKQQNKSGQNSMWCPTCSSAESQSLLNHDHRIKLNDERIKPHVLQTADDRKHFYRTQSSRRYQTRGWRPCNSQIPNIFLY